MVGYNYIAIDADGNETSGMLEAESSRKLRQHLREQGLIPVEVRKARAGMVMPATLRKKRAVTGADRALLTRELASLISAGLPLDESLQAVAQQLEKQAVKQVVSAVRAKVMEGFSLAAAMAEFSESFPEVYRATVAAGEQSGHLDVVLNHLADYTEQQQHMRQRVTQAMVYPSLMTIVSLAIVIFLLIVVVPRMIEVFNDNGQQLPVLTQTLLVISSGLQLYGVYIAAAVAGLILLVRHALKNANYKRQYHRYQLKLPVLGRMIRAINTARFSRTLGILSSSGVPILHAFRISAELISNTPIRQAVLQASDRVREGQSIHRALQETGYFLPVTIHFISNGETSGRLEEMLKRASDNQERSVLRMLEMGLTLFEPLLILCMGGIVLFIVLAVVLPMFEMTQMI